MSNFHDILRGLEVFDLFYANPTIEARDTVVYICPGPLATWSQGHPKAELLLKHWEPAEEWGPNCWKHRAGS